MPPSRKPGEGQEGLFVESNPTDIVVAQAALPEVPDAAFINRFEQARYLSDVLTKFDALPDRDAWLAEARNVSTRLHADVYSKNPQQGYQIIKDRQEARDKVYVASQESFKRAYGMYAAIDSGLISQDAAERGTALAFKEFEAAYMGSSNGRFTKREAYNNYLKTLIDGSWDEAAPFIGPAERGARTNFKAGLSLGRLLRPETLGLNERDYESVSRVDTVKYALPNIRKHLLDVNSNSPNAFLYVREKNATRGIEKVTVVPTPDDRKLLYSPTRLAESAVNKSESKQTKLAVGSHKGKDAIADPDAPRRGGVHATEARQKALENYIDNVLQPSLGLIGVFEKALKYGASRFSFGRETGGRMKFIELQTGTLEPMFWAASVNANYSNQERTKLRKTVEKYVHFARDTRNRRNHFAELLALARDWREAEVEAYQSVINECIDYQAKHQPNEQFVS